MNARLLLVPAPSGIHLRVGAALTGEPTGSRVGNMGETSAAQQRGCLSLGVAQRHISLPPFQQDMCKYGGIGMVAFLASLQFYGVPSRTRRRPSVELWITVRRGEYEAPPQVDRRNRVMKLLLID